MMATKTEIVTINFLVREGRRDELLKALIEYQAGYDVWLDFYVTSVLRDSLDAFARRMEAKLKKNDHKNDSPEGWHALPIEGLIRQMLVEIEEFKVADDFFAVKRTREELVDIANFAMIVDDRLSTLEQDTLRK